MKVSKNTRVVLLIAALILVMVLVYAAFTMSSAPAADRVLLVASDVLAGAGGSERFASYLADKKVAVVPYNYDRVATYAELADLVKAQVEGSSAAGAAGPGAPKTLKSVGIMYHTPNRYSLQCFASDPAKSTVDGSPETFESVRRFVAALRATYGVEDVDLISCDVVSATSGVLASLDYGGARVNASTNTTGQVKGGPVGDWVLEMGNADLIGTYFNGTITQSEIALKGGGYRHLTKRIPSQIAQHLTQTREAPHMAKSAIVYLRITFAQNYQNGVVMSWKIDLTGLTANEWPRYLGMLIAAIKKINPQAYAGLVKAVNDLRVPKGGIKIYEITNLRIDDRIAYPLEADEYPLEKSIYCIQYIPDQDYIRAEKLNGPLVYHDGVHGLGNVNMTYGVDLHREYGHMFSLPG